SCRGSYSDGPCWVTDESGEIYHISKIMGKSLTNLLDLAMRADAELCPMGPAQGRKVHRVADRLRLSMRTCQTSFFCDAAVPMRVRLSKPGRTRLHDLHTSWRSAAPDLYANANHSSGA